MARSFGRVLASIWDDEDFRDLSTTSRLMYLFLLSQADLEHSGIIPLRIKRWARATDIPLEDVAASLKELGEARFVVMDETEGELLVRSLIRRDEIWRQPNVFKAAAVSARACKSAVIKAALLPEVRRLDLTGTSRETQAIRDSLITHLEPFDRPNPTPPDPFPSPNGEWSDDAHSDKAGTFMEDAGQNPSRGVREPQRNSSAGVTGKGEGYGPVLGVAFPHSPTPSPVADGEPCRPLWPAAVPDEPDSFQDEPPDIRALVAEVRAIRPDWATRSIRRALNEPSVRERPWPTVRRAMLAVAADPASKQPGRLAGDGDWWHQRGSGPDAAPPTPWCGKCPPNRRLEDAEGRDAGPCPACNPKARAS